jgi:predicted MPP superfamily phosphohydrolase
MNRLTGLLMFLLIVVGIYFVMNWYVLGRLAYLFGIKKTILFYIAVTAITLSLPAAIMLNTRIGNWFTGAIYSTAAMWVGICFLAVWCLIALQVIGWFVKIPQTGVGVAAIVIVAVMTVYAMVNARAVRVHKIEINAPVNLRIAQISDEHIGSTGGGFFSHVVDEVNSLKPDVVLITGDLVDNDKATTAAALENLNRLAAPVFFVTGNHERYVGYDNVRRLLAPTRVRWLANEAVTLDNVRIFGANDNITAEAMDELLGRAASEKPYTILMYHRPEWFDTAARRKVNLMLTGHTHRGQIWPFNFVVGSIYKYIDGLHEIGQMYLNVSTGTGTWGPRMRLGSHSEIVMIQLKVAQ